jgi:hypothetical protein
VAGATFGVAAGYGEVVLLAVDCAWLVAAPRIGTRARSAMICALAMVGASTTIMVSPLSGYVPRLVHGGRASLGLRPSALIAWAALGPLGEALPALPWTALYVGAITAVVWAVGRAATHSHTRLFTLWLVTVAAGWAFLTSSGVGHPRYSLALWFLTTCALGILLARRGLARLAALASAAYLAFDLALTIGQRSFPMADENMMVGADCRRLLPLGADLIVTAYARTTAEIERTCKPGVLIITAGFVRHYPAQRMGEVAGVRFALVAADVVDFVRVNVSGVSLEQTNDDVRTVLAERCRLAETTTAGEIPHRWLRELLKPGLSSWHYTSERWRCSR